MVRLYRETGYQDSFARQKPFAQVGAALAVLVEDVLVDGLVADRVVAVVGGALIRRGKQGFSAPGEGGERERRERDEEQGTTHRRRV